MRFGFIRFCPAIPGREPIRVRRRQRLRMHAASSWSSGSSRGGASPHSLKHDAITPLLLGAVQRSIRTAQQLAGFA